MGGSFENWWCANNGHLVKLGLGSTYYEGLVLSMLLDYAADPAVWIEIASRRWLSVHLVAGCTPWAVARQTLPMTGLGNLPATVFSHLHRAAKMSSEWLPAPRADSATSHGSAQRGDSRSGYNKKGTDAAPSKSKDAPVAAAGKGKKNRQHRGSEEGAGASTNVASAGAP